MVEYIEYRNSTEGTTHESIWKSPTEFLHNAKNHEQVTKQFPDRTHKTQPNKMGMTPQYFHTTPTSRAILSTIGIPKKKQVTIKFSE